MRLFRYICVGHVLLGLTACTFNPATGRSQLLLLSTEQEIELANEAMPALTAEYGGEVAAPQLRAYVHDVGGTLAARTEANYPSLPWEFTVLNSDVINAFALPAGKVFVSRGLLERLDNEAQVAGVLGHEIGHVTAQHVDERLSQAMVVQGLTAAAGAAAKGSDSSWAQLVPVLVGVGGQGYMLSFSRDQESEADEQGVRYMTANGYDPHGMLELLQVLAEAGTGSRPPEFLSTHPYPETRLRTVQRLLAGRYRFTQNNPDFGKFRGRFESEAAPYLSGPSASRSATSSMAWCAVCAAPSAQATLP
ncbi:MAG: M48 family metalloprotease [Planctomycetota bacterium]|jgi:predicted Zn-dependent protease